MASEMRFAEVRELLERNHWSLVRISGSHHIFEKAGSKLLSVPVHHGKVKPVYVRQIERAIKES